MVYLVPNSRGVGAMEIVAMDMKLRGAYIARQLSFKGVRFTIDEVPLPVDFAQTYDASVDFVSSPCEKFGSGGWRWRGRNQNLLIFFYLSQTNVRMFHSSGWVQ